MGLLLLLLIIALFNAYQFSELVILSSLVFIVPLYIILTAKLYQQFISPLYRITNMLEAIRVEDHSLRIHNKCDAGIVKQLQQEIQLLNDDLQQRKTRHDQSVFLIYRLITQLNTPILVFDHQLRLNHANLAFSEFLGLPWQTQKGRLCSELNLRKDQDNRWHFTHTPRQHWQLRHSQFEDGEQTYHLVIMTNIAKAIRQTQQMSWQQIIRVLSHEIRNSLTPISSLTQTLIEEVRIGREVLSTPALQALATVAERSGALQQFVKQYAHLGQKITINKSSIDVTDFFNKIKALFPNNNLLIGNSPQHVRLYADKVLLEQVLINLIKNAIEASSTDSEIRLIFTQSKFKSSIRVLDTGHGIINPDNLFIPFYTTKKTGQGIGLTFCRNIIEHHQGHLMLQNRQDQQGAEAIIELPDDHTATGAGIAGCGS